jgi:hypothetical protein
MLKTLEIEYVFKIKYFAFSKVLFHFKNTSATPYTRNESSRVRWSKMDITKIGKIMSELIFPKLRQCVS